jgi:hypothetical protein
LCCHRTPSTTRCRISSSRPSRRSWAADHAVTIEESDCVDGLLPKTSVVKLAKVFTIHSTLVIKKICALRDEKLDAVLGELRRFFS